MRLYEYAAFKDEWRDRDGKVLDEAQLLVPPAFMLAKDEGQVTMKVARMMPEEALEDSERIFILVRPF